MPQWLKVVCALPEGSQLSVASSPVDPMPFPDLSGQLHLHVQAHIYARIFT